MQPQTMIALFTLLFLLLSLTCAQTLSQNTSTPIVYATSTYFDPFLFLSPFADLVSTSHVSGGSITGREGAAYVDDGETEFHIAGGMNGAVAYPDIYVFDTVQDYIYACTQPLPNTLYYSTSDFVEATEQWYIVGGITSSPTALSPTYNLGLYQVDFNTPVSNSNPCPTNPPKTVTLSPAPAGRQWAASLIQPGTSTYYVFGGINTVTPLSTSQLFFTVTLGTGSTYITTPLSTSPAQFVHPAPIDPMMMIDKEADEIFFYSGWVSMNNFEGTHLMYRYDTEFNVWLEPLAPLLNSHSAVVAPLPDIVFAGKTHTVDGMHYLAAGGADSSGYSGDLLIHVDLTTENFAGAPTISTLFTETPLDLQGGMLGVNQELDIFLLGGKTVFPNQQTTYPTIIYEAKLPVHSASPIVDYFAQTTTTVAMDDTYEFGAGSSIIPPQREGAAYGSWEGNDAIVFAGGAFIAAESILAYTDIWYMSLSTDQFIRCTSTLPVPNYFGVSEFVVEMSSLFFWGGRTSVVAPNVDNQYNSQLWRIDFSSGNINSPAVSSYTLSGISSLVGTQYSSIIEAHEKLYIFGGLTGATGTTTPSTAQQWLVIDLTNNYATSGLSTAGANFPSSVWINPTLFTEATENYIYLYSGMWADGMTWNSPFVVSIYSIVQNAWLPGVEPQLSPYTSLPNQLPNIVFAGHAMSLDDQHLIMVGGSEGPHSPYTAGTHNKVVHIDATPLNGNQTTASPLITVLPARLLYPCQSPVVALEVQDTEIVVYGGSYYSDPYQAFPQSYNNYVQELTLLNHQNVAGSASSSNSRLSGGAIAGIVIGTIVGVLLLCLIIYLLGTRSRNGKFGRTTTAGRSGEKHDMEMGDNTKPSRLQEH